MKESEELTPKLVMQEKVSFKYEPKAPNLHNPGGYGILA
jgi:hypothetical protein